MDGDLDLGPSPKLATLQRSAAPGSHMIGAILVHDGASSIGQEMAPAAAGSRNGQGIAGTRERLSRAFQPVSRWGRRRRTATRAKGLGRECQLPLALPIASGVVSRGKKGRDGQLPLADADADGSRQSGGKDLRHWKKCQLWFVASHTRNSGSLICGEGKIPSAPAGMQLAREHAIL